MVPKILHLTADMAMSHLEIHVADTHIGQYDIC